MNELGVIAMAVATSAIAACLGSGDRGRRWIATAASCVVLLLWQPLGLVVTLALAGVTIAFVTIGRRLGRQARKRCVWAGIAVLVGTLLVFKYVPWILSASGIAADRPIAWAVPLGLSFTVFRLIGILLDSEALKTPVSSGEILFLSLFFPTFRSGPITTLQQLRSSDAAAPASPSRRYAFGRITTGLFRKAALADPLHALIIAPWLAQGIQHVSALQAALLGPLLGLFVYWDFAGYSDLAIGIGALLGYRVPENFDRPYLSVNLLEFWRRWHMTLSEWIRTRLMMKMVGRRSSKAQVYLAIVASMAVCGIWHGAGLNFLVWGLWHGLGIVGVHLFGEWQRRSPAVRAIANAPGSAVASVVLTFAFVSLGWLLFFLSFGDAVAVARQVLLWRYGVAAIAIGCVMLLAVPLVEARLAADSNHALERIPMMARGALAAVACGVVVYLVVFHQVGQQEFVYAQF